MHVIVCVWSAVMKKQQNEKRNKQKNAGKKYVDIKQTNILTPCSLAWRTRKPVWLHSGSVLLVCCACVRVDEEAGRGKKRSRRYGWCSITTTLPITFLCVQIYEGMTKEYPDTSGVVGMSVWVWW